MTNTSKNIDVDIKYQKIIKDLLKRYIPNTEVWAYGSRVKWTSKPQSDLDMVVFASKEHRLAVSNLKEAFEESSLPFRVDLFIWDEVPEQFHKNIIEEHVILQSAKTENIMPLRDWKETILGEAIEISPLRSLKKGDIAKKIPMDVLNTNDRSINGFEETEFTGSGTKFKNGDTLLARITPCLENGKTAYVSCLDDNEIAFGSTEYIVMSGKKGASDNLFVYYLAREPQFRSYAIAHMEGSSGRQRVPAGSVAKYQINLPPLPEQHAIAEILGSLDDKIELNQQMNKTLEGMAQVIFKSWFVDNSENFEVDNLSTIAILNRINIVPLNSPDEIFYHYSLPAFDQGQNPVVEKGFEIKSNKYKVEPGMILLSKLNPHIPRVWFPFVDNANSITSTEFLPISPTEISSTEYLYCLFKSQLFWDSFSSLITGTSNSHQRVKPDDVMNLKIAIPDKALIVKFTNITKEIFQKFLLNIQENLILSNLRDSLLPKLVSGEIRVQDAEKIMEDAV